MMATDLNFEIAEYDDGGNVTASYLGSGFASADRDGKGDRYGKGGRVDIVVRSFLHLSPLFPVSARSSPGSIHQNTATYLFFLSTIRVEFIFSEVFAN